ncbi:2OG-Fe(II) oxygenase family protein [Tistrella mobilis]
MFAIDSIDMTDPQAPARFLASLCDTGFAVLRAHSIDAALIRRLHDGWARFFADPAKHRWTRAPGSQSGYFPFRSENAKGVAVKDLKEFFHVYPDTPLPPGVADDTREIYRQLSDLGTTLLGWIQEELPAGIRDRLSEPLPAMIAGSDRSLFRVLNYPPVGEDAEPGAVRAAAHEDINLITLLVAGSEPGLEARDTAGRWHAVPCDAGMIAVNGGDMLALATAGYLPATTHRVVNPARGDHTARQSMPIFIHPRPEVRLAADKTAAAYLAERLREIGLAG